MPNTATQTEVRELTFAEAIREALAEEMRRDSRVCILGEDVAEAGTPFKVLSGLVEEFGKQRVMDTPISEPGFTGIGVGAAMTGLRPVVDIMFGDFLTLIMDQIVNQAAKIHYMSGGTWKVPMVLRTTMGASRRSAAQHSQSLHAWPSHIPGLKVVLPSTPYDAKGLLKSAIRDDNPVIFFEDKMMYRLKGPVPTEEYTIPLGRGGHQARGNRHHAGGHQQHGASGAGRGEDARGKRRQRGSDRSADHVAAGRKDAHRIREEDFACDRHRRRLLPLWGDGGDRLGDRRGRVLQSGWTGEADRSHARAHSLLSSARGRHHSQRAAGIRGRAGTLRKMIGSFAV